MVTKQRVFSHNNTIHYNDYLKIKQGTECLKTIHADNRTKHITLHQFVNYDQFMYLSKAFYKQVNAHKCKNEHVSDLYNANSSYIQHNQYDLKPPLDFCNSPVLYPYGQYTGNQLDNFYFPNKLDMNQLCRERNNCYDAIASPITYDTDKIPTYDTDKITTYDNDKTTTYDNAKTTTYDCNNCPQSNPINPIKQTKCKTGLCKNAKQLFI